MENFEELRLILFIIIIDQTLIKYDQCLKSEFDGQKILIRENHFKNIEKHSL